MESVQQEDKLVNDKKTKKNVVSSIRTKIIGSVIVALIISPTISTMINGALNRVYEVNGNFAVYISTIINLIVVSGIVLLQLDLLVLKPLRQMIKITANLELNSQVEVKSRDEIGKLASNINRFTSVILGTVDEVTEASNILDSKANEVNVKSRSIADTSQDIGKTIEEIAKGATSQAEDTERAVMTVNEMGNLISTEQEKLEDLYGSTRQIYELKSEGSDILKKLIHQTEDSSKAANVVNNIVTNTNESAVNIKRASEMIG